LPVEYYKSDFKSESKSTGSGSEYESTDFQFKSKYVRVYS